MNAGFGEGVIDGDGSLGLSCHDHCFISLVTASERLRNAYVSFVSPIIGYSPATQRNKRDGVYNICVFDEKAQKLAQALYGKATIAIPRKLEAASRVVR